MTWNEQVEAARSANLAEYFRNSGYECELRRDELHVKGFGGLFVNVNTNGWYCFSENKGGSNAVNCLTEMLGKDFKTAVTELSGSSYTPRENISFSEKKKDLQLPEKADNMRKVFAYLCKTRGISPDMVSQLAHEKLLYQDVRGNAVFVHKNESGETVGAEIQGTNSEKRFKGVATGTSDSVFAFKIGEPKKCYVFESAIDLMSFKQLANQEKIQNSLLVSMAGLKPNSLKSIAEKGIKIYSCVDNDEAGREFEIANGLPSCRKVLVDNGVKDYNELLKKAICPQEIQKAPVQKNVAEKSENEKSSQKKISHSRR
ncbi:MAG: DUF3991 and toprim domain-containing protein [Lachnospiraceae bacterium]|nr:DUF3991 and toprim domain-containing protein [Ruminococcus sp.]MCM1276432.1 DUF3991 and toprim domain-containing protein [Lachnospiraceae bacterium]